jgi:hypothetical protein
MWRLPIGFVAPFTMKVEYDRKVEDGKLQRMASLSFHVCDDGKDSYVHVTAYGQIFVSDAESGASTQAGPAGATYSPGKKYTLEIVHDGRQVTSLVDGVETAKAEVGKLAGGGIEVMAVCDGPAFLHKVEITGKVDPASIAAARGAWVTRMMLEMGF